MRKWIEAMSGTRAAISRGLAGFFGAGGPETMSPEEVEERLLHADVPLFIAEEILGILRREGRSLEALREVMLRECTPSRIFSWQVSQRPFVILVVGVNGSGKTTTAAKLARMAGNSGLTAILGAADTYRAAGSDQLRIWAERCGCDVVTGAHGADSAAVAFDTISAAKARGKDVVIVDTAGRMHTRKPLMDELAKTRRSIEKCAPGAPHETWLVLDATLGNNALRQVDAFKETIPLTGVVLTKLDGSAKAGFVSAIHKQHGLPVLFAGLGEKIDDLVPFDAREFVEGMFPGD